MHVPHTHWESENGPGNPRVFRILPSIPGSFEIFPYTSGFLWSSPVLPVFPAAGHSRFFPAICRAHPRDGKNPAAIAGTIAPETLRETLCTIGFNAPAQEKETGHGHVPRHPDEVTKGLYPGRELRVVPAADRAFGGAEPAASRIRVIPPFPQIAGPRRARIRRRYPAGIVF